MTRPLRFACFLLAGGPALWAQHTIHLRSRDIHIAERHHTDSSVTPGHYILGFSSYPGPDIRASLTARGIRVLQYVPDTALMVAVSAGVNLDGLSLTFAAPMRVDDKLAPGLRESSTNTYVIVFHSDIEPGRASELVAASGFDAIRRIALPQNNVVAVGPLQRLAGLAANDEVAYVLPASAELASGVPVVACPGAITEAGPIGEYALVKRGWSKDASGAVELKYVIQSLTEKADPNVVRSEIERALREWGKYANLTLTEGSQPETLRTIAIRFARGGHGDDHAFDGPGNILAHTFYPAPPNSEPAAGDIHIDADEDWQIGGGIDIYSVVLHELGHALGLDHSTQPGAVMYPYFHVAAGLTADDISGIQDLYGAPAPFQPPANPNGPSLLPPATPEQPPVTPPTEPPPTEPPLQPPTTPTEPPVTPSQPPASPTEPPLQPPSVPTPPPSAPSQPPVNPPEPPNQPPMTPSQPSSKDTTAPSLRIVSPATTIVSTSAASISVSGTASDNIGLASVQWSTSTGTSGAAIGAATWSASIPLLVGTNVIQIRAFDTAGNSSWRAVTVVRR